MQIVLTFEPARSPEVAARGREAHRSLARRLGRRTGGPFPSAANACGSNTFTCISPPLHAAAMAHRMVICHGDMPPHVHTSAYTPIPRGRPLVPSCPRPCWSSAPSRAPAGWASTPRSAPTSPTRARGARSGRGGRCRQAGGEGTWCKVGRAGARWGLRAGSRARKMVWACSRVSFAPFLCCPAWLTAEVNLAALPLRLRCLWTRPSASSHPAAACRPTPRAGRRRRWWLRR